MSSTSPISLDRRRSSPRPKPITAIRFDSAERLERLDRLQDCNANPAAPALGVLFGPGGSAVVFMVDRESVLNKSSRLKVLSEETPAWAESHFGWEELISRVRAAIHASDTSPGGTIASFGNVQVDFDTMEVSRRGTDAAHCARVQDTQILRKKPSPCNPA